MIDYYRRNDESAAFEGTECTPEWVSRINASGFIVKAAYVGYTDAVHVDSILAHAKNNKHDWITIGYRMRMEMIAKFVLGLMHSLEYVMN